jgi:hypothetical protein
MKTLFCFIVIVLVWGINNTAIGAESTKDIAMGDAYFDVATGKQIPTILKNAPQQLGCTGLQKRHS